MTGRAAGYCAGNPVPGFVNAPGGRGFGVGRGFGGGRGGRGWRNQFYATGLTGWQRAAAGLPAYGYGVGPFAPVAQTGPVASPAASQEQELGILRQQAETMEQQMKWLRERIEKLETQD